MDNIRELNEVPVTECLFYVHLAKSLYYTNLAYSKETYILYAIDMWYDIIIPEPSIIFFVIDLWQSNVVLH